jgi:hypothetical protein
VVLAAVRAGRSGERARRTHLLEHGERALGRCLTLIYASLANGGKCTNVAGQGPDAMQPALG